MRYRTGCRAFDKPRWVAARMRVEVGRDLTMRAILQPDPARSRTGVERPASRRPD